MCKMWAKSGCKKELHARIAPRSPSSHIHCFPTHMKAAGDPSVLFHGNTHSMLAPIGGDDAPFHIPRSSSKIKIVNSSRLQAMREQIRYRRNQT